MSQSGGFDLSKLSTASKILLGAGILYLIDLFLQWQRVCFGGICGGVSGMDGIGIINLLLVIALLAWEGMAIAGVDIKAPRALVSAGIAGGIVVFTILKIIVDSEFLAIFAWIGLILAAAIGYGGWMRWQEHQAGAGTGSSGGAMPPPPAPGGFS
ncbi:MAG: hypothetical protein ACXWXP_07460 [Actinomycetota bacterium]